jgi:hypothetical protein
LIHSISISSQKFTSHISSITCLSYKQYKRIANQKSYPNIHPIKMSGLDAAQLAVFAVLSLPVLYLIYSHGRRGFLGWGFLLIYCILRMTGAGMAISNSGPSAQIISSIGLSPMLLALDGILHEACVLPIRPLGLEFAWLIDCLV